jgi:hypothetical protein
VLTLGITWFVFGLILFSVDKVSLAEYLITVFLPSQPAFLDTIDLFKGHLGMARDKQALEDQTTKLWETGSQSLELVTAQDCREVQDQSYRLRRSGIHIPQVVYNILRNEDEHAMRAAVDRYVNAHASTNGHNS